MLVSRRPRDINQQAATYHRRRVAQERDRGPRAEEEGRRRRGGSEATEISLFHTTPLAPQRKASSGSPEALARPSKATMGLRGAVPCAVARLIKRAASSTCVGCATQRVSFPLARAWYAPPPTSAAASSVIVRRSSLLGSLDLLALDAQISQLHSYPRPPQPFHCWSAPLVRNDRLWNACVSSRSNPTQPNPSP